MENFKTEVKSLKPLGSCIRNPVFAIYSTTMSQSPHLVLEIAKQRKLSFESVGVKITSNIDLDDYDVSLHQQSQMFIWDTEKEAIVGGYRYSYNATISPEHSPMGRYFSFTQNFVEENWIHLGRSFLSLEYQKTRHGIFALMNGLGCLFAKANNAAGFYGKVTVPALYQESGATDFIVAFCKHSWMDGEPLGSVISTHEKQISDIVKFAMEHTKGDYREFVSFLDKNYKMQGLPIMRMYDSLAEKFTGIYFLGAFVHKNFGGSTEIGMAISKENLSSQAYKTHIEPYMRK